MLGLAAMAVAAYFAHKNRYNTKKCISSITLGVFFATFFMVLPTQWVKEGKEVFYESPYAGLSSLLYSLKTLGGRQDISQLESMDLPEVLKAIYIVLCYIFSEINENALALASAIRKKKAEKPSFSAKGKLQTRNWWSRPEKWAVSCCIAPAMD